MSDASTAETTGSGAATAREQQGQAGGEQQVHAAELVEHYTMGGGLADLLEEEAVRPPPAPAEPEEEKKGEAEVEAAQPPRRWDLPASTSDALPPWVKIPRGFRIPRGRRVLFLFFKAEHTDAPEKGNRQCILWSLVPEDEKFAFNRAMGDVNRAPGELAKQMVRAVDGYEADWSGLANPGSVDHFWKQIGPKYRDLLTRIYAQVHVLTAAETDDFFANCVAVRSMG